MIDQTHKHRSRLSSEHLGIVGDQKYRLVTPEQFKKGYIILSGVTPSHHNFIAVGRNKNGDYIVLEPNEPT